MGARFREEREHLSLTQAALATQLFTSDRTIKNYESGASSPKGNELARFADLGADVQYIITGVRVAPPSVQEPQAAYLPAERLAQSIRSLPISEADAKMIGDLAKRLAAV